VLLLLLIGAWLGAALGPFLSSGDAAADGRGASERPTAGPRIRMEIALPRPGERADTPLPAPKTPPGDAPDGKAGAGEARRIRLPSLAPPPAAGTRDAPARSGPSRTAAGGAGKSADADRGSIAVAVDATDAPDDAGAPADTPAAPPTDDAARLESHRVTVRRGDSLFTIFRARGLSLADLHAVVHSGEEAKRLARIRPGQEITLDAAPDGRVARLVHRIDETHLLEIERVDGRFRARVVEESVEARTAVASGHIQSSLFVAAQRAGLSDALIMRLVEIFGWDVDFALDIREGDRFTVIYEELWKDGEKLRDAGILAAEFVNRGRAIRALRYAFDDGRTEFYSPDGRSMRKAFLRTPVPVGRVSSHFDLRRMHPVLHRIRAHRGVDYAAPTGTPVKATGDGKIILAGRKGGYGRTIVIRHGEIYTTLYAHLSRLASGMRAGRWVRQGQTIGYVGATGLATGPHLHYEFRLRGVHKNPLTVRLPKAEPIPAAHRERFARSTAPLLARLDLLSRTQVAQESASER